MLTKFSKFNGCTKIIKSDHNILFLKVKCSWSTSLKTERVEIFNLRNKECQKQFFEDTNSTSILSNSLENRQVVGGGKIWLKNLNTIIHRNFKKIRITAKHKEDKIQKLITNRRNENESLNDDEISELISVRNRKVILEQVSGTADLSGNLSRLKMWKLKQKICPKIENSVPVAKLDERGNLVSNTTEMKQLYVRVYKHRLRHRDIQPELTQLRGLKEQLFSMRKKVAFERKSENWNLNDLMKVLKSLKVNKASDPVGLVNELFKPGVAGEDLIQSILTLCNMMKEECQTPAFIELANITSILKNKGNR